MHTTAVDVALEVSHDPAGMYEDDEAIAAGMHDEKGGRVMGQNTNPGYWYEGAVARHLAEKYERALPLVCGELAYIAGDYADMSDDEVIETWVNDESGEVAA